MITDISEESGASEEIRNLWEMLTRIPEQISVAKGVADAPLLTRSLEEQLNKLIARQSLFLPNLQAHNETIAIFSDYGGESPDSRYHVFSFLICAWNTLAMFRDAQSQLRFEHKLNAPVKELAFKSLGYGPLDRALPGYIRNLNNSVPGVLVSVVIEKGRLSLWGADRKATQREIANTLKDAGLGDWKPETAEKLVTVVHLVSYFIALLAENGQKVFWQSDNDAIMANEEKAAQAGSLFASVLRLYTKKRFATLGYAKAFGKDSTLLLDLLSAPDLVAGSIEHFLTRQDNMPELTVKQGANQVLVWHGYQGIALKKYAFIFRAGEQDQIQAGNLEFVVTTPPAGLQFIGIPLS